MAEINHKSTSSKMMCLFLKTILLLCLIQHSVQFGMAGSEIRANRAPITCFPSDTRRYSANSSAGSSSAIVGGSSNKDEEDKENNQLEQNTKYVKGLLETLETLLDKWIVSGAMATVRYELFLHYTICTCTLSSSNN